MKTTWLHLFGHKSFAMLASALLLAATAAVAPPARWSVIQGINAVPAALSGHSIVREDLTTLEACKQACVSNTSCAMFSYNFGHKPKYYCFLSSDKGWGTPAENNHITSGCLLQLVKGCPAPPAPTPPPTPAQPTPLSSEFVPVAGGSYKMGYSVTPLPKALVPGPYGLNGDYDEKPYHPVTVSALSVQTSEITFGQYEQFAPGHREKYKLTHRRDDEAVVMVSWEDAMAFAKWATDNDKQGRVYRLPTEAEWEWFARANTTTYFNTGDEVPAAYLKKQKATSLADAVVLSPLYGLDLGVMQTPANAFGVHDTVGNVEEWCLDWFGSYSSGSSSSTDPVGPVDGDFKVARGGSHSTLLYFLRSANRAGTLPQDRSAYIGFRLVRAPYPVGWSKVLPPVDPSI